MLDPDTVRVTNIWTHIKFFGLWLVIRGHGLSVDVTVTIPCYIYQRKHLQVAPNITSICFLKAIFRFKSRSMVPRHPAFLLLYSNCLFIFVVHTHMFSWLVCSRSSRGVVYVNFYIIYSHIDPETHLEFSMSVKRKDSASWRCQHYLSNLNIDEMCSSKVWLLVTFVDWVVLPSVCYSLV